MQASVGVPLHKEGSEQFHADANAETIVPSVNAVAQYVPVVSQATEEGKTSPASDGEVDVHVGVGRGL